MTTQRKLTRPGLNDNEFMTVTCTPDKTAVEFFEFQSEAEVAARANLHPSTTSYVGKVIKQGEHAVRGAANQIALLVEVDAALRKKLFDRFAGSRREHLAAALYQILANGFNAMADSTCMPGPNDQPGASGGPGGPAVKARPCATDNCGIPAARNSDYCPLCRSARSGHGL